MGRNRSRGYGKEIGDAVNAAIYGDAPEERASSTRTWLTTWTDPAEARHRFRQWLSMWLKGATAEIPAETLSRYFSEMADDVMQLSTDEAVDRLIDKLLPKIVSNERGDQVTSRLVEHEH